MVQKVRRAPETSFSDINVLTQNYKATFGFSQDTEKILIPNNDTEQAVSTEDFEVQLESPHF